jgi:hypothetical protein
MDTYLYINFVDTTGQRTRLYPNKRVLAFVTPSSKILQPATSSINNLYPAPARTARVPPPARP